MKRFEILARRLVVLQEQKKKIEESEAVIKGQLKNIMPLNEEHLLNYNNSIYVLIYQDINRTQLNQEILKEQYSDVYQKCLENKHFQQFICKKARQEIQNQAKINKKVKA